MAEFRSEFLHELMRENENFSEEQSRTKLREYLEEGDRETAPVETAPAPISQNWYVYAFVRPRVKGPSNSGHIFRAVLYMG